MDSSYEKVLLACAKLAEAGKNPIDVFDIIYETSIGYVELKPVLDILIGQHKIEEKNGRTYRYIGDHSSDLDMRRDQVILSDVQSPNLDVYSDDEYAARQRYLERKRQELIERLEAELASENSEDEEDDNDDELYIQALSFFIKSGEASISLLQREFGVGYGQACQVMDILEENGFISSSYESGFSGKRRVLISMEEFRKMFGDI